MEHEAGIYEVMSNVTIRREPRIIQYEDPNTKKWVTNQVGSLSVGTKRVIYSIQVQKDNSVWGRVSESDSAGIAQWVCIQDVNRTFLKFIEPLVDRSLESRIAGLESRVLALELALGKR